MWRKLDLLKGKHMKEGFWCFHLDHSAFKVPCELLLEARELHRKEQKKKGKEWVR